MSESRTRRIARRIERRAFLGTAGALALGGKLAAQPASLAQDSSRAEGGASPTRLIVVELAGGNDGLNTVVPRRDPEYLRARPSLAVRHGLHVLDERFGLHPKLAALAALHAKGEVATVLGVGYPAPDRSHFRSMDIWQSARPDLARAQHGWLGLAADLLAAGGHELPALALGLRERPLALAGKNCVVPVLGKLADYRLFEEQRVGGQGRARRRTLENLVQPRAADDALERLIKSTARQAYRSSEDLAQATRVWRPQQPFPKDAFGRHCELAARALASPLGVRILWLRQGGYDTHAGQARTHGTQLASLASALGTLAEELRARKLWKSTRILVFSEFGRRVAENRSRGTDHGAAGPVFVLGGGVRGAVLGEAPSLTALDRGDLRHGIDFRWIYAEILEDWLGLRAAPILGRAYAHERDRIGIVRSS